MRKLFACVVVVLLAVSVTVAQNEAKTKAAPSKKAAGASAAPDRALAQKIWDAWCTLDTNNPAPYYDQTPSNLYFDLAPRKYNGFQEYKTGAQAMLAGFQSCTATVNPDLTFHRAGNTVWADGTIDASAVMKDGNKEELRWTAVWENKGGKWLIVHEHVSVPMPESEKK